MSMEKNGAISSDTPDARHGSEKRGGDPDPSGVELGLQFPTNTAEADAMVGDDLTSRLNNSVERASKSAD